MHAVLTRVDPEKQMNRWYIVAVQASLLEPVVVLSAWGSRQSTYQRVRILAAASVADAQATADKLIRKKVRRGYQIVSN
jgi:predicted DNA-binding WGR domain protein